MAKHPHKLILLDGRTWRCVLDGCSFFVHLGLKHVLLGKRAVCWNCGELFIFDEYAMADAPMPRCPVCRGVVEPEPEPPPVEPGAEPDMVRELREAYKQPHKDWRDYIKEDREEKKRAQSEESRHHAADCDWWGGCSCSTVYCRYM